MSMSKKVLVTGAGGFIGSHLTERLVRDGHQVRAFVRYNGRDDRGNLGDLPADIQAAIEVERGDLKDPGAVRCAVDGREWVFHLGALIAIPYSYHNPYDVVQTNVLGTAHVLDACRASSTLARLVLTSTSEVYGTAQTVPIDERHPLQGQSPYAATKIGADALGESYFRAFGLPVTILRPFNTFGPRQSARAIIPTIISQALARPSIRLGRLDPRRDLTYVKDTVAGFVAIAGCDAALGRAVNIGRGEDISIGDLVETDRPPVGPIDRRRDRSRAVPARRQRGRAPACRHGPGAKPVGLEAQVLARGRARRDDRLGARPSRPLPGRVVHDLIRRRCQPRPVIATLDVFATVSTATRSLRRVFAVRWLSNRATEPT